MLKNIPIYEALINDDNDGITVISLVDDPAVESNFVAFSKKEKTKVKLAIENESEHMVLGVVMRADYPIYRNNGGYEYYITYSPSTIKKMAEKMMSDANYRNVSLQHDGHNINGVELVQVFIKDTAKGINPIQFEDISDGSLFAQYHITDDGVWNQIKSGEINGFSLEGWFGIEEVKNKINQNKTKNMLSKIKEALKKMLVEFGNVEVEEGITIYFDGDELVEGIEVADENGEAVADGVYHYEEKEITVVDGKVTEIKEATREVEKEDAVETVEEKVELEDAETVETVEKEVTVETDATLVSKEEFDALKGEIENLKAEIESIKAELVKPVKETVVEEFKTMTPSIFKCR